MDEMAGHENGEANKAKEVYSWFTTNKAKKD